MKKNIFLLLSACLLSVGQAAAGTVLTVSDVDVPQGGQATIEIGCEFDTEYTAFELQLSLPQGLSLLTDDDGKPIVDRAFEGSHAITGNLLPSNGNYKFTGYSTNENALSLPASGPLLRVTVLADATLTLGSSLTATVTASEFTRTSDSKGENLADVTFAVNISEFRTILDETSATAPAAEESANVRVRRTINANEWSTICLPFGMTAAQVQAAFNNGDVQLLGLAEFKGWETTAYDEDDNATAIQVMFSGVDVIAANTPYIIKVSKKITEFTVDGVDIDPEDEPMVSVGKMNRGTFGSFTGSYVPMTIDEECLFLSDGKFWYSAGKTAMKGYRAYFYFQDVLADYSGSASSARISMRFDDGTTTGVGSIDNGETASDSYYDLQGRKIEKPVRKGLYIRGGKKVVK